MQTLKVYTTPPQMERKGAQEARQAGHRAYVPSEPKTYTRGSKSHTRRVPSVRGYLFSEGKPHEAKYIKASIGTVTRQEITRLYVRSSKTQRQHKFGPGDQITIKRGAHATLAGTIMEVCGGGWYAIAASLFGRVFHVKMKESDISHHTHPHIK